MMINSCAFRRYYGVDYDPKCLQFSQPGVTIVIGDQEDPQFWQDFKEKYPPVSGWGIVDNDDDDDDDDDDDNDDDDDER
jgi:hypothetical protein